MKGTGRSFWPGVATLFIVPVAHPILIPLVGVPSHLLWWAHVLPVAMVTYRSGRRLGGAALALSALLVIVWKRRTPRPYICLGFGGRRSWAGGSRRSRPCGGFRLQ